MVVALSRTFSMTVLCSASDAILVRLPQEWDAEALRQYLQGEHAIRVESCGPGLTGFLRLAVRPESEVSRLIDGVSAYAGRQGRRSAA